MGRPSFGEPNNSGVEDSQLRGLTATLETTARTAERFPLRERSANYELTSALLFRITVKGLGYLLILGWCAETVNPFRSIYTK